MAAPCAAVARATAASRAAAMSEGTALGERGNVRSTLPENATARVPPEYAATPEDAAPKARSRRRMRRRPEGWRPRRGGLAVGASPQGLAAEASPQRPRRGGGAAEAELFSLGPKSD